MMIFTVLASLFALFVYLVYYTRFNTKTYESILTNSLSGLRLKDALTDEVFITSYSYNEKLPRFYTKLNA